MSVETVPKSMKQLRACLVCSLVKSFDQFENDGCENCEAVLRLKRNRDNVYLCTSSNFEGMIAACKPEDSWVCRWQRINKFNKGIYAISVQGRLPASIVSDLRRSGIVYKSRDTSKM
eukprot:TRINITY_DN41502_c0_g1_i1.p1 TRINITY_DN41502_c0_g1~~TRINITY_DN41502_c0_g1_i1.p1  ORF type:complete len:117 (-),score=17.32 TRINITY_DN41502_c0_g1_i1:2-352(-)